MNWTPEIVRARWLEAADTDRRLPVGRMRPAGATSAWMPYSFDDEDRAGWDDLAREDEQDALHRRRSIPRDVLNRYEQVLVWRVTLIDKPDRRKLADAWAACTSTGDKEKSFAAWCRTHGIVRMTAYRRLRTIFERISTSLGNVSALLELPAEKWVLQVSPPEGISGAMMSMPAGEDITPSPKAWMEPDARPVDTLDSPEAVDQFAKHLAALNKEREARRRRLLGVEEAA